MINEHAHFLKKLKVPKEFLHKIPMKTIFGSPKDLSVNSSENNFFSYPKEHFNILKEPFF